MNKFFSIVKDIKDLRIQGAQNIAEKAVEGFSFVSQNSKAKGCKELVSELNVAKDMLFSARATEPGLRNALNYIIDGVDGYDDVRKMKGHVHNRAVYALRFFKEAENKIIENGYKKIKKGSVVYTHCHSSTVLGVMKKAWRSGRRFELHNTETRPRFQGRVTAKEMATLGVPVIHYVDSAMRFAIKKADIVLLGADAITSEGQVLNKVGSELVCETAHNYDVPVYVCTNSWKFDSLTVQGFDEPIERRHAREVWPRAPKGVTVSNFAFEKINPDLIDGIISELGVLSPENFFYAVSEKYGWMFGNWKGE